MRSRKKKTIAEKRTECRTKGLVYDSKTGCRKSKRKTRSRSRKKRADLKSKRKKTRSRLRKKKKVVRKKKVHDFRYSRNITNVCFTKN